MLVGTSCRNSTIKMRNAKRIFLNLITYLPTFCGPRKVGEMIKRLSDKDRKILSKLKSKDIQDRIL